MCEANEDVVTMVNVNGATLQSLVRFCYLGRIDISDDVEVLLAAASAMELVQVEKFCEQHCLKQLSRDSCLRLWWLADRYSLIVLQKKAYAIVLDPFPTLVGSEAFLHMEKVPLQQLLADNGLSVYSEEDVFEALAQWVRSNTHNRKAFFVQLINSVRVKEMKPIVSFARRFICMK